MIDVQLSPEVAAALADQRAIVALESTIFSHLGLPSPANREALTRCLAAVRAAGAVPAVTAVLDGVKAGEQVVTQGQVKLRKGMAVTIDENAGLKLPSSLPKQ